MNLIITCPRHFEEDAAQEITEIFEEFGYQDAPKITITDMPGILTAVTGESPLEIAEKIGELTREEPWSIRYLQRVIPIQKSMKSELIQIVKSVSEMYESVMGKEDTYRITIEKRHSDLSTKQMITEIAQVIPNKVSLEGSDWIVLVEILGGIAGVSVLKPNQIISIQKIKRSVSEQED